MAVKRSTRARIGGGPATLERPSSTAKTSRPKTSQAKPSQRKGQAKAQPVKNNPLEVVGPKVIRNRVRVVGLLMALPVLMLWLSYAGHQLRLPDPPEVGSVPHRGRILLRDGTVLAESYHKPGDPRGVDRRAYPQGALAGQLVGFKGTDKGLSGLEGFAENRLQAGGQITLTLDPVAQAATEAALERWIIKQEASAGAVVMLEAGTNHVLAVANYPRFSPSRFNPTDLPGDIERQWNNRAFRYQFEPGSTMKALIAAALIDAGEATPDTPIYAPMYRTVGRHVINDSIQHRTDLTLSSVLRYSSNVGISKLAERLSPKLLHSYLKSYGFGQPMTLEGASPGKGKLRDHQTWKPVDFATATFGQGVATNALQLATAFSVLTNDGRLVPPVLIEGTEQEAPRRVLSERAARQTRTMLASVVEEGLPHAAAIKGYCVGGKTGTAQVAVGGKYSSDVYDALFAGFFPCDQPKVTMVVEVFGAKKQHHGSQVAAPAFREIAEEVLANWGVPPTEAAKK